MVQRGYGSGGTGEKQMPLAHEWSQSERTPCSPPQGRKRVNTELVMGYSPTRRAGAWTG